MANFNINNNGRDMAENMSNNTPVRSRAVRPEGRIASAPRRYWADAAYRAEQEALSRARASQQQEREAAEALVTFMRHEYREEAAFVASAQAESPLAPSNSRIRLSAGIDVRNFDPAADLRPLAPEFAQHSEHWGSGSTIPIGRFHTGPTFVGEAAHTPCTPLGNVPNAHSIGSTAALDPAEISDAELLVVVETILKHYKQILAEVESETTGIDPADIMIDRPNLDDIAHWLATDIEQDLTEIASDFELQAPADMVTLRAWPVQTTTTSRVPDQRTFSARRTLQERPNGH